MFNFLIVLSVVLATTHGGKAIFRDCGSKVGTVENVDVNPCVKAGPACELNRGNSSKISITFRINKSVQKVSSKVHGIIAHIPVPFPLQNPDGCKNSGLKCPIHGGKTVTYTVQLPIKNIYPEMGLLVKWELKNEKNEDIICITMPVKIV